MRELFPSAFAIAMLGAIESLLSAVIADGMTGTKHDPNAELVALGIGNIVAPFFGGIAATGALARTATNIRAGARSPFAAVMHSAVVLLAILCLAPLVAYVPMASLAALLAARRVEHVGDPQLRRASSRSRRRATCSCCSTCFVLTVLFDMVMAVSVGVVLAALLFMRRMAELTESRTMLESEGESGDIKLPAKVGLYEIDGPLFFGAAQNAMGAIHAARGDRFEVMVLHLGKVPVIDATGLVALDNAIGTLTRAKKQVVLAGPLPRPRRSSRRPASRKSTRASTWPRRSTPRLRWQGSSRASRDPGRRRRRSLARDASPTFGRMWAVLKSKDSP